MTIKIRLLQEWQNGDKTWPEGQLLMVEEADAVQLVKDGICENYTPKATDVIVPADDAGGMTSENIKEIITEHLKEVNRHDVGEQLLNGDSFKTGGFQNMAEFAQHVFHAETRRNQSEQLKAWSAHCKASGMSEGVQADGGFLIPTEFRNDLLKDALGAAIIRPRATVIPMSSTTVKIPVVNESSRASSVYGGVIIYRPAEAAQKTASAPVLGQIQLTLHKLVGLCYVTDELLEDSPVSLQPLLTTMFSEAIAFQEDEDFINGTGANEALGILNAPCLVSQAKESGQTATTIVTENIVKMWSRLKPRSAGNAVWLANPDTFPSLATLKLDVGTGGSTVGLVQNIAGSAGTTLLGRPLILTEHCQTLGTEGDVLLCDWRQYLVGSKASGLQVASSIHLKFDYDETAFRFVMRYDGQPWEISARTPKHGSNTLSSFVSLAVRS